MKRFVLVALVVCAIPYTAHADIDPQGRTLQGRTLQGRTLQGRTLQGTNLSSINLSKVRIQSVGIGNVSGVNLHLEGSNIVGSLIDSYPFTCSHNLRFTGAALPASCNKCSEIVNTYDPYCGQNEWDSICVAEAEDWCSFESADLVGARFTAKVKDPITQATSDVTVILNSVQVAADPTPSWYQDRNGTWINGSLKNENADVLLHDFVVYTPAVPCSWVWNCGPSGCFKTWSCVGSQPEEYTAICETNIDGLKNKSIPIAGQWNDCEGQGCGGKTPGTESDTFSLSCSDEGALAKCAERYNYKPWEDRFSTTKAPLHESCVRMVRADYCGDGVTHTYDGNWIDVYDRSGIQELDPEGEIQMTGTTWGNDAIWNPNGAHCVVTGRFEQNDPTGGTLQKYVDNAPTCQGKFIPAGGEYEKRWRCGMVGDSAGVPVVDADPKACEGIARSQGWEGLNSGTWCDGFGWSAGWDGEIAVNFPGYMGNRSISIPYGW